MIRFTGYGFITEKPRVGQLGRIFPCTCRKNCVGSRNDWPLFDRLYDVYMPYHHAKFGEDRTTRAGCRCEHVVFVAIVFFVCHTPSPEHRAFEGCIVRTSIALPFIGRFRRGSSVSQEIALSDTLHSSHIDRKSVV